jgi:DNA-binding transcriptional MocR family regulator
MTNTKNLGGERLSWINRVSLASREELSDFQVRVAGVLIGYVNRKTGDTYVSQPMLAADLGVSVRYVRMALDALIAKGYLAIKQSGHGPGQSNLYRLTLPATTEAPAAEEGAAAPPAKQKPAPRRAGNGGQPMAEASAASFDRSSPKTWDEFIAYTCAWLNAEKDTGAIQTRWDSDREKNIRETCRGVVHDAWRSMPERLLSERLRDGRATNPLKDEIAF